MNSNANKQKKATNSWVVLAILLAIIAGFVVLPQMVNQSAGIRSHLSGAAPVLLLMVGLMAVIVGMAFTSGGYRHRVEQRKQKK
jgi:hypothetical protein